MELHFLLGSCLDWGNPVLGFMGFQDCCCQWPYLCGQPLSIQASNPTVTGSLDSVTCGVTAPFLRVLVCTRFCLCPPRLVFLLPLVLWKSYNQIPLYFKSGSLNIPSPFVGSRCREARCGVQNIYNSGRTCLVLLFFSLWVSHSAAMGFDFMVIVHLIVLLTHLPVTSSLSLDMGYFFFWWTPASSCLWLFNS